MLTSTADGVTDQSGGGHQGTHQDHKISSLVQAASKALSGQQQQSLLGAAAAHSHLHNDNLVSEAGMPSVKTEPSSVNSLTHVAAGRVGPRPGGAGVAPPLPSIPGQGTLKAGTLPCSKTQVRILFGGGSMGDPQKCYGTIENKSYICTHLPYFVWLGWSVAWRLML